MNNYQSPNRSPHRPVLYQEVIEILQPKSSGVYVDGTLGAGGHAAGILEASQSSGRLIGLDVDRNALTVARKNLAKFGDRVIIRKGSYANMHSLLRDLEINCVQGIVLDLGVSSMQLDQAERGFSFIKDAPLDMRFNHTASQTAADLINKLNQEEIAEILTRYGEEPHSRKIAAAIVQNRPIHTTAELADLVTSVYPGRRGKRHPATRTFQALRIALNKELEVLQAGLEEAQKALCSGGRLAVISFHSLEDRIVKQFFQRESKDCLCPPEQPLCTCGHTASLQIINKKPIRPAQEEVEKNPRARSAKLRAVEKL